VERYLELDPQTAAEKKIDDDTYPAYRARETLDAGTAL
jgi:hypothetical protein